jgi:hypothetical protein
MKRTRAQATIIHAVSPVLIVGSSGISWAERTVGRQATAAASDADFNKVFIGLVSFEINMRLENVENEQETSQSHKAASIGRIRFPVVKNSHTG